MGEEPAGVLRLTVPRMAVPLVIEPVIPVLRRAHPKAAVEISVEDAAMDLPAHGYDAGIRIGEMVERDMVAVRLTRDIVWSVVASPAYLAARGTPQQPEDLTQHDAIRGRHRGDHRLARYRILLCREKFHGPSRHSPAVPRRLYPQCRPCRHRS